MVTPRSEAESLSVNVPNDREFIVTLEGRHLKFLLALIKANNYPGDQVFLVGATIHALQKPLLDDAHGALDPGLEK